MKRLLIAMSALTLLAGCTSSKASVPTSNIQASSTTPALNVTQQTSNYPPEAITAFMQGCTAGHPSSMEKNCGCMIQQIQSRYTYSQYQALVQANSSSDPSIQEISSSCADTPTASTTLTNNELSTPSVSMTPANNGTSYIQGQDGAFLGMVSSDRVAEKSVCNQVGAYGSQVTPDSIRNQVGNYGSQISGFSAYNSNAGKPPIVIQGGQVIGVLTKNRSIKGGIDPDLFLLETCVR